MSEINNYNWPNELTTLLERSKIRAMWEILNDESAWCKYSQNKFQTG